MQFAPLYPLLYRILQPTFPNCLWTGDQNSPAIALTFDDGPHPQHTPRLLEVLQTLEIQATFFSLGVCVNRAPQLTQQIYQQGHWIGLHGYDHRSFPLLNATQLRESLQKTQEAIATACNLDLAQVQQTYRDVRPPNGLFTPKTLGYLQAWGYRPVMWSVVPEDWAEPSIEKVLERVLQQVTNGSVIVLHDGHYGGANVAQTTALLVPELLKRGYKFVRVDSLWQSSSRCDRT